MRIIRMSSVETGPPVARDSSFLMRVSMVLMTSLSCLSSSSMKPIFAVAKGELDLFWWAIDRDLWRSGKAKAESTEGFGLWCEAEVESEGRERKRQGTNSRLGNLECVAGGWEVWGGALACYDWLNAGCRC